MPQAAAAAPVYRFAKISNGAYFYTGSEAEKEAILRSTPDMRYEGVAFGQSPAGGDQVYRFANLSSGGYFFTANEQERDVVVRARSDMRFEGSSFTVPNADDMMAAPVYRLANTTNGAYLYTASAQERAAALALGYWRDEGVAFRGYAQPVGEEGELSNGTLVVNRSRLELWAYMTDGPAAFRLRVARVDGQRIAPRNLNVWAQGTFLFESRQLLPVHFTETIDASTGKASYEAMVRLDWSGRFHTENGRLRIRLCEDDAQYCNFPIGEPLYIPFRQTNDTRSDPTLIPPKPHAWAWSGVQGGASHDGFVSMNVDAVNFRGRWMKRRAQTVPEHLHYPLTQGTTSVMVVNPDSIEFVDEGHGHTVWYQSVMEPLTFPPVMSNGRVVFGIAKGGGAIRVIDLKNTHFPTDFPYVAGTAERESPPTLLGNDLYLRRSNGVARYNIGTGALLWTSQDGGTMSAVQPAIDANTVYSFNGESLIGRAVADGALRFSIPVPRRFSSSSAPVLGPGGLVFLVARSETGEGHLLSFDTVRQALRFDVPVPQALGRSPVLAHGLLYLLNGATLEARSPEDGGVAWSWRSPDGLDPSITPVVVGKYVFVGSDVGTLAVDVMTRTAAWREAAKGPFGVSEYGFLHIGGPSGLYAVRLR